MSQSDSSYSDGRSGLKDPYLAILNYSPVKLLDYMSDTIDRESVDQDHADSDGGALGSDTGSGAEKGAISFQFNLATDQRKLRPGHILHLDIGEGAEYYVARKPGVGRTRNQTVKGSVNVIRAVAPVFTDLLSETKGQFKSFTQAAGSLTGTPAAARTVVNTRTGATLAYSMAAKPGNTLPAWLSINASTGALTGTAVAGTFDLDLICTDTVTGEIDRVGYGRMQLVIT